MSLTLRQICLVAEKFQAVIDDLKTVLGLEVGYVDSGVAIFGLENSLLPLGTNFLEVVSPVQDNTAAGRYLQRRKGDGGYMVITQADSAETQAAVRERADRMGIRIAWEREHGTGRVMQLHPGDTGGSFFEVDWDAKNEHQGHWTPAGGTGWEAFVRTNVVSAIKAAELQSPDPASLAQRWSEIAGIPVQKDTSGNLEMTLNNAVIRFVEATDGRREGLGGIDIEVVDRKFLLGSADERGLKISDSQVMICGLRFNLV